MAEYRENSLSEIVNRLIGTASHMAADATIRGMDAAIMGIKSLKIAMNYYRIQSGVAGSLRSYYEFMEGKERMELMEEVHSGSRYSIQERFLGHALGISGSYFLFYTLYKSAENRNWLPFAPVILLNALDMIKEYKHAKRK